MDNKDKEIKPSRWGKLVKYGAYSSIAAALITFFPKYGLYNWHVRNEEIKTIAAPLRTEVKNLKKKNTTLDSALKTTVDNLEDKHKKEIGRIAKESKENIAGIEGKVRSAYDDSLRMAYQFQFSKHSAEIRDFVYKFEKFPVS